MLLEFRKITHDMHYMHYSITDFQANFGINRLIRYQVTANRQTDGVTDRRTDIQTSPTTTIGSFFSKKNTKSKCM